MAMKVHWLKCGKDAANWCSFEGLNLASVSQTGVYVIWHGGEKPHVVYVGQGDVAVRIAAHRGDKRITAYAKLGLWVTWAELSAFQRDGVERYLADRYSPLVGDAHPIAQKIVVHGPWD